MKDRILALLRGLRDGKIEEVPIPEAIRMVRREYTYGGLDESHVDPDPLEQFETWFQEAVDAKVADVNAMALATATPEAVPAVRMVLLKEVDDLGFVFYTNYESRKAHELTANPRATLLFYWHELDRQVRIEGTVERVSETDSAAYFESRPRDARLAAWASPQSDPIADRPALEKRFDDARARFPGNDVPLPPFWGGYRVVPERIEFWQGRVNRLHDRLLYERQGAAWSLGRLCP